MKTYILLILCFIASACNTYKYKFVEDQPDRNYAQWSSALANSNKLALDEIWIIFNRNFDNNNVKVLENDSVKYDSIIATAKKYPEIAKVLRVKKNSLIKIYIDNHRKPIEINKTQMSQYTAVYITKMCHSYEIEFTNHNKLMADYAKSQKEITEKFKKKLEKDSIK